MLLSGTGTRHQRLWSVSMALYALALIANMHAMCADARSVSWTRDRSLPVAGLNLSAILFATLLPAPAFSRLG